MITVVICSVSKTLLANVKQNILNTIGVPCEILGYDNSLDPKGICEVYNIGAKYARYSIICFAHEDIHFKTHNWGRLVVDAFNNDPKLGLLGVAGASYKSLAPTGWGFDGAPAEKIYYLNILQTYKHQKREDTHLNYNPRKEKISVVSCVDGLWLCTKKSIVLNNPFDESLFKGFHCYDIDFSLSIAQAHKIAVTQEVLIHHSSEGQYDRKWWQETIKLHKKWSHLLPINSEGLDDNQMIKIEKAAYRYAFKELIKYKFSLTEIFRLLKANCKSRILSPYLNFVILKTLIRLYFKDLILFFQRK